MKTFILSLFLGFSVIASAYAQTNRDQIAQPTHVVGKRINSSGQVTLELVSEFQYSENGKPLRYEFPNYDLSTNYTFDGDFLTREYTRHDGGYPTFGETLNYTYENDKVKTISIFGGR